MKTAGLRKRRALRQIKFRDIIQMFDTGIDPEPRPTRHIWHCIYLLLPSSHIPDELLTQIRMPYSEVTAVFPDAAEFIGNTGNCW
jgi:hypothetical protein